MWSQLTSQLTNVIFKRPYLSFDTSHLKYFYRLLAFERHKPLIRDQPFIIEKLITSNPSFNLDFNVVMIKTVYVTYTPKSLMQVMYDAYHDIFEF